jgi:hypothetical protein
MIQMLDEQHQGRLSVHRTFLVVEINKSSGNERVKSFT